MAHDSFSAVVISTVFCEEVYIFQEQVKHPLAGICVLATKMYNFSAGISIQYFFSARIQFSPRRVYYWDPGEDPSEEGSLCNIGIT